MISVKELSTKMIVADPYFYEDGESIQDFRDIYTKICGLQEELKVIEDTYHLWRENRHNLRYGIYFRGQPIYDQPLLTKVGRLNYRIAQERDVLHRFRRRSYFQYQRILTNWEALFLSRHFGLPTRLLDWTAGQFVGLYWACQTDSTDVKDEKDGAVWVLVRQPDEGFDMNVFNFPLMTEYQYAKDGEYLITGVKLVYPIYVHPRMTAQASLFTIQDDPANPLEKYDPAIYTRKDFDIFHLRKWKVPNLKKKDILRQLDDIGINKQTLFPDIEGLATGIEQTEKIRLDYL